MTIVGGLMGVALVGGLIRVTIVAWLMGVAIVGGLICDYRRWVG